MRDLFAMRSPEPGDRVDHGVKGMKWGVRRSSAQLRVAATKRGDGQTSTETAKTDGPESPGDRYNRLKSQASTRGTNSLSDDDLRFFNNRTEALRKVNQLYEQKPGWFKEAVQDVLRQTAKKTMQEVADALAKKHISGPLKTKIKTDVSGKPSKKK